VKKILNSVPSLLNTGINTVKNPTNTLNAVNTVKNPTNTLNAVNNIKF
jgi:hypothetical protein